MQQLYCSVSAKLIDHSIIVNLNVIATHISATTAMALSVMEFWCLYETNMLQDKLQSNIGSYYNEKILAFTSICVHAVLLLRLLIRDLLHVRASTLLLQQQRVSKLPLATLHADNSM
jgi:hypothetical protein